MKLIMGTVQFGLDYGIANKDGKPSEHESCEIMRAALDYGIDRVDTAQIYGDSEKILGNIAKKLDTKLNIVTKTSCRPEEIISVLKKSLHDLNADSIYGFLAHYADDLIGDYGNVIFEYMKEAKDSGLVEKIGVTVYTPEQVFAILKKYPIDIIQIPCNILDQRFVKFGAIRKLAKQNVEIHMRSIFLQGLLLMDVGLVPDYFNPIVQNLSRLHAVAETNGISVLKLLLEYVKSLSNIDRIIVGVQNFAQLHDIISAYNEPFEHTIGFEQFAIDDERFINPSKWTVDTRR